MEQAVSASTLHLCPVRRTPRKATRATGVVTPPAQAEQLSLAFPRAFGRHAARAVSGPIGRGQHLTDPVPSMPRLKQLYSSVF